MNTTVLALKQEQIEKEQLFWSETWRLFLVDNLGTEEEEERGTEVVSGQLSTTPRQVRPF